MVHKPVLKKEVLRYLDPRPDENFIDATIGGGGHTMAIIKQVLPKGQVLGIDWSGELVQELKHKSNLVLVNDSYVNLKSIVEEYKFKPIHGILFDLGLSSWHLEKSGRGFSFLKNEELDMRYNLRNSLTAAEILNQWKESEIEKILKQYGQERFAKKIAKKIIEERKIKPIKSTFQLKDIIKKSVPVWYRHKRLHFATRTFQALRIAVNDELNNLEKALPQTLEILEPKGRLVIISFHSLEDRIVKNFLRESKKKNLLKILTKKPITPSKQEIKENPRSRSAKLRAGQKLNG